MQRQIISFSLPPKIAKKLDSLSKKQNKSRSQLLRELIENYEIDESLKRIFAWGKETKKKFNIKSEEDILRIIDD